MDYILLMVNFFFLGNICFVYICVIFGINCFCSINERVMILKYLDIGDIKLFLNLKINWIFDDIKKLLIIF